MGTTATAGTWGGSKTYSSSFSGEPAPSAWPAERTTLRRKSYCVCTSRSAISNAASMTSCRFDGPSPCGGSDLSTVSANLRTASSAACWPLLTDSSTCSDNSVGLSAIGISTPGERRRRNLEANLPAVGQQRQRPGWAPRRPAGRRSAETAVPRPADRVHRRTDLQPSSAEDVTSAAAPSLDHSRANEHGSREPWQSSQKRFRAPTATSAPARKRRLWRKNRRINPDGNV